MPKKRKSKSQRIDISVRKKIETEGVDFFPFLAGMITSLAMIFLIWNQFTRSSDTKPEVIARSAKTTDARIVDPNHFDTTMASGNPDQMEDLLYELVQSLANRKAAEQVKINFRRIEVADQMLEMNISPLQVDRAKDAKLDSLSRIYGLNYLYHLKTPDIARILRETASAYLEETDPKLVKESGLALIKLNVLELAKSRSTSLAQPIADEIVDLLKKYPEDEIAIATIRLTLGAYLEENENGETPLIEHLCERKNEFTSSKVRGIFEDFSDKVLLLKARYRKLFDDRWVNGPVGQLELLNVSVELINAPDPGSLLIRQVDEVAHWFEQEDRHENAIQIYNEMLKAAENGMSPATASLGRKTAVDGLQRNRLVRGELELIGFAPDGSAILPEEFNQRVVVVIFWSTQNEMSMTDLRQFHHETNLWLRKPITVLAVCVDENSVDDVKRIAAKLSRFRFMIGDNVGKSGNRVLEQCPSARVPRAMLIGKDGLVVDVNVPMGELRTNTEGILYQTDSLKNR